MKTIITGNINSGKTTALIEHYQTHKRGDGFACIKIMRGSRVHAYEALRLKTGERKLLTIHKNDYDCAMGEAQTIGPYRLLNRTIAWMENAMQTMKQHAVAPIYFDEIGPLEIAHQGFHAILKLCLECDYVVVIRKQCLEDAIAQYQMHDATIVDVSKKGVRTCMTRHS